MLEAIRKNKALLWIIASSLIIFFGLFGYGSYLNNTVNSAGTIFGHNVSIKDFQEAYDDARDQAILIYGEEFFKHGDRINLEQEAWNRLIKLEEAKKRNIQVSDQEVVAAIAPIFQKSGQFDQVRYEEIVQNIFNQSTHDFEEGMRKTLIIQKLENAIAPEEVISDADLKKEYQKRNEKLTLEYILFSASDYGKKATASDDEIKTYYDQHREEFRLPPTIVLNYVQTRDKALADTLSKELTPISSFAAVAKQLKLEVKTSSPFTHDQPILTFASNPDYIDKFFQMKPGEYSPPLEVPDGWQIVQLKEKNDSTVPALQDIKAQVKDAVLLEKGFALAKPPADRALQELTEALKTKDFKTAATGLGLKVEETPSFGRKDYIANVGLVQEFQQEADELNTHKRLSGVIATSEGPAIIYLEKMEKPADAEFESDKANFREQLNAESRNQILITFMSQLRAKADVHSKIKHQ